MDNDKKLIKKKRELEELELERAKKKVLYDSQLTILEGQRKVILELEQRAKVLHEEYNKAHCKVDIVLKEINELTNQKANELDNGDKKPDKEPESS